MQLRYHPEKGASIGRNVAPSGARRRTLGLGGAFLALSSALALACSGNTATDGQDAPASGGAPQSVPEGFWDECAEDASCPEGLTCENLGWGIATNCTYPCETKDDCPANFYCMEAHDQRAEFCGTLYESE